MKIHSGWAGLRKIPGFGLGHACEKSAIFWQSKLLRQGFQNIEPWPQTGTCAGNGPDNRKAKLPFMC